MFKQITYEKANLLCDSQDLENLTEESFNLALNHYQTHAIGDEKQSIQDQIVEEM